MIKFLSTKNTGRGYGSLLLPGIFILIIIILLVAGVQTAYTRIKTQYDAIVSVKQVENVLEKKLTILKDIDKNILSSADSTIIALPDEDPTLLYLAQIRSLAQTDALLIVGQTVTGMRAEGATNAKASSYSLNGDLNQLFKYFKDLRKYAPVTSLERVNIATEPQEGILRADVAGSIYWANLPVKLPDLTEPITALEPDEEKTLLRLKALVKPEFTQLEAAKYEDRPDPFN